MLHVNKRILRSVCTVVYSRDELNCTCGTGTKSRVSVLYGFHLASQIN